jgi:hypothetical protein
VIEDLRTGKADLSKLVISKSLSKEPEKYNPMPIHAQLAIKLKERDPATAPRVGDRVPYLLVQPPPAKNVKISACGEDPKFALDHDVPIFVSEYIEMLRAPVERILEPLHKGLTNLIFDGTPLRSSKLVSLDHVFRKDKDAKPEAVLEPKEAKKLAKKKKIREGSDYGPSNNTLEWARSKSKLNIQDVEDHLKKVIADKRKEKSANMKRFVTTTSSASPLLKSCAKVLPQCLACRRTVKDNHTKRLPCKVCMDGCCDCEGTPALCSDCASEPGMLDKYLKNTQEEVKEASSKNDERWAICKECVGSIEDAEDCCFKECGTLI